MRTHHLQYLILIALIALVCPFLAVRADDAPPVQVTLKPTPLGQANGFEKATASALVYVADGWVTITMKLPEGYKIPDKTVFEGWLVDEGALVSPTNNSSTGDERFGPRYGNRTIAALANGVGYWLTTGALASDGKGNLTVAMHWPNYTLDPYENVAITIETDGNETPWDPRPGSTILEGAIADGKPGPELGDQIDTLLGPMPDLSSGRGVSLKATKLGEAAGLKGATGKAFILTEGAAAELSVTLAPGTKLPEGTVMEGWVCDAGRLTPFGPTHAHEADNKLGPALNNVYLSAILDAIPFSTTLGVLKQDSDGVYKLQVHWNNYAFRVYDIVAVTLESDGDQGRFNPRPGTPALVGAIVPEVNLTTLLAMPGPDDMLPPSEMGRLTPPPPPQSAAATAATK